MKKIIFFLLLTFFNFAQAKWDCIVPYKKEVIDSDKNNINQVWETNYYWRLFASSFSNTAEDTVYEEYIEGLFPKGTQYSPIDVMANHVEVTRKYLPGRIEDAEKKLKLVKERVRKINCLEKSLFRAQVEHCGITAQEELGAIVLSHPRSQQLKMLVVFRCGNPYPSVRFTKKTLDLFYDYKKLGWENFIHIHSHPLGPPNKYGDMGPIGPSGPDLDYYRKQQFKRSVITDGLHSVELIPDDYN